MTDERCIERAMDVGCSVRGTDWVVAGLAQRQHGVVARWQMLERGISRTAIGGRIRAGRLHPVHLGVYSVGHARLDIEGRWMAAVLACGPGAVLSHRSGGQLLGLLPRSNATPEVSRPGSFRIRSGIVAHRAPVPGDEIAMVDGIPVTSVSRTLLDLAAVLGKDQLERALNEADIRGLTDRLALPDLLQRYPRRRGSATLRALLNLEARAQGVTRNDFEQGFKALLTCADLPLPRFNAHLAVRGRFFEIDCLWAEQRLVVELDGREVHGTPRAFEQDRERDRLLLSEGWRVVRVTWRQVRYDGPAVIADLRGLLRNGERAPTL